MDKSIKSHPPSNPILHTHWEAEVEWMETGMWDYKDYKDWIIFFHMMFVRRAAGEKNGAVRGDDTSGSDFPSVLF